MGAVSDRSPGQAGIVYLVTSIDRVRNLPGVVLPSKHPERRPQFTTDLTLFDDASFIDWDVMFDPDFRPREDDTDRKDRRQAEVLVHREVPLDLILGLAARTEDELVTARGACGRAVPRWHFKVRADWYF